MIFISLLFIKISYDKLLYYILTVYILIVVVAAHVNGYIWCRGSVETNRKSVAIFLKREHQKPLNLMDLIIENMAW